MRFSVIIPAHNRARQLMLTLASFEKQTCPIDQFEVVVVNDGSTDDTLARLQQYQPPYRLSVVSLSEPAGRAVARNIGVSAAKEDMLVFCDADFLVTPDFIQVHEAYHTRYPEMVISGMPNLMQGAYTQFHADFSEQEKAAAAQVLKQNGLWRDEWMHSPHTIDLVTPEDIRHDTGRLSQTVIPWHDEDPGRQQFRTTDVAPWVMFVTRNISLSRALFEHAGWFDGIFQKYGLEDWELGYRLHAHGYKFVSIAEKIGCHQEHPAATRHEDEGNHENLRYFFGKHGVRNPEISLFAVLSLNESFPVYKNMLRILLRLRRSRNRLHRLTEQRFRQLCSRTADRFVREPHAPAFQRNKAILKEAILAAESVYSSALPDRVKFRRIRRILNRAIHQIRRSRLRKKGRVNLRKIVRRRRIRHKRIGSLRLRSRRSGTKRMARRRKSAR